MGCCKLKPKYPLDTTLPIQQSKSLKINSSLKDLEEFSPDRRCTKQKSAIFDPRLSLTSTEEMEIVNGVEQKQPLSKPDRIRLTKILSVHFIFNSLSTDHIQKLTKEFKTYSFASKKIIFSQGHRGQNFYIISSGSVEVLLDSERKAVISENGYFGEMALIYNSKRTASIKTIEKTTCWVMRGEHFRQAIQLVSSEKLQENKEFLVNFHFFNKLTDHQKDLLLSLLVVHEFEPGQRILREREKGKLIYIVKKGEVVVSVDGVQQRVLGLGEYFGEQALLYNSLRTASVDAIGKVVLLSLDSKELVNLLGNELEYVIFKNSLRIGLERSRYLAKLEKFQKEKIVEAIEIKHFKEDEVVIYAGTKCNSLIIFILKGEIISGSEKYSKFDIIGENELLGISASSYKRDYVCSCDCIIGIISKIAIDNMFEFPLRKILKTNKILKILKKINIFRNIPLGKLEALISKLKSVKFDRNEIIFEQDEPGDILYIIKSGEVTIKMNDQIVRQVIKNDYFGERSLILSEPRTATVISQKCTCWMLQKLDFLEIITPETRSLILKRIELQDDSVLLKDLKLLKRLGKGTFGNVFVAYSSKTKLLYALKTVDREKIESYEIHKNLIQEKKIMLLLDHPFIVKLVKTFMDRFRVYFLMELVQGIDLFDLLRKYTMWEEDKAKFYVSCLVLVLEHLHERNVVYRDLKPENIIIDSDGYPKLIDFGLAKVIQGRTYSVAGSSHYMAPEVIKGIGYGIEADYWSLGVIIYEFLCNRVPWGEYEDDPIEVYNMIVKNKLSFPKNLKANNCIKLMKKLLNQNPALRGNIENIKKDIWFSSVNFDELIEKKIESWYKPSIEDYSKFIKTNIMKNQDIYKFIMKYEDSWKKVKKEELDYSWEFGF